MSLVSRTDALAVRQSIKKSNSYYGSIASAFYVMMNNFHSLNNVWDDYEIEKLLLKQQQLKV